VEPPRRLAGLQAALDRHIFNQNQRERWFWEDNLRRQLRRDREYQRVVRRRDIIHFSRVAHSLRQEHTPLECVDWSGPGLWTGPVFGLNCY
jgi:hypothetical protein